MKENAIVITGGILVSGNAKTAHGLTRNSSRYHIVGVVDSTSFGSDAGELLDGKHRNIPVYASIEEFVGRSPHRATYAIVGIAVPGGKLPPEVAAQLKDAIAHGMSVVSGLHDFLSDSPEFRSLADKHQVQLIDIRKPREKSQLKFWSGDIFRVTCPIVAVLGTDCAIGKRTTAVMLTEAFRQAGMNAHMIFTGQTGWLQGHRYGFILDSTYNDFISGELERAIVQCYDEERPDLIFVEGQSALCNPSGPCGAELLLSAQCKGVVLQHAPARTYYAGHEHTGMTISLAREIALIRLYGAEVIAVTLNTKGLAQADALKYKEQYEQEFNIPVVLPLQNLEEAVTAVTTYADRFDGFPANA